MSTSMKAGYLETRTFTDPRGRNGLTTLIQRTVDLLLKETKQPSNQLHVEYTRVLCAAAADCLESARSTKILEELKKISIISDCGNVDVRDMFAAAAHVGNVVMLKKLIDKGVDIDAQSRYFGKPLRGAAFGGHRDAVLLLLDSGADANAHSAHIYFNWRSTVLNSHESTALQAAALAGHEHVARLLLEPKYLVSASGMEYERAILYAARGGHLSLVRFLMNKAKIMQPEQLQQWILLKACCYGHEPIARMMLDLGTSLNDLYKWDGSKWDGKQLDGSVDESPLEVAATYNFHKIVQLLLARGADPNKGGEFGDLPLCSAVQGDHERVAQMLLDHGADINAGRFNSPLEGAVKRGSLHMVRFLLERGAALNTKWRKSETLLAAAAYRGHEPMVRLLVKFGASVDGSDEKPNQAMLEAMRTGHDHVVKTLIELGAKKIKKMDPPKTVPSLLSIASLHRFRPSPFSSSDSDASSSDSSS